jgi:hypothetical protein
MPSWRKLIVSGSDASLSSLQITNAITASIVSSSQFTGSLFGTSSWAHSASWAPGTSVTINNNVDNYIITATGTSNTLNGEQKLIFNSSNEQMIITSSLYISGNIYIDGIIFGGTFN